MGKARKRQVNKAAGAGLPTSFAKAYDMVLRENPGLYEAYRRERWVKRT